MLFVIKRSGKEEPFDPKKLKKTIAAASDEINHPLNESDIKVLAESVLSKFKNKEKVTSKEVYETLITCLRDQGFGDVAEAYINFANNSWI